MTTNGKYNGYTNYETWCVTLWLENEEVTYRYWREQARRHVAEAPQASQVQSGYWTAEQAARFLLADQLKEEFDDTNPLDKANVWSDLLGAALHAVDWHEVAEQFLTDFLSSDKETLSTSSLGSDARELLDRPMIIDLREARFRLGQLVITPAALDAVSAEEISTAINRHLHGDWGLVCAEDVQANERAVAEGTRLLSSYDTTTGLRFWIITEADRSATTILLPEEY